jgi:NitT/TauT family transport system substrate-binding protein
VRRDSPIRSAAELTGHTVASVALGDLLSSATLAWIDAGGGDSKQVRQLEIPASATLAALQQGRVDAAAIQEPRLTDFVRNGGMRLLGKPYDVIGKRFLNAAIVATTGWAEANRETVERLARAILEINAFCNAHPDQTAPWLAEFAKVDLDAVVHSTRAVFAESINLPEMQVVVDAAVRFKVIDKTFDVRELVNPALLSLH